MIEKEEQRLCMLYSEALGSRSLSPATCKRVHPSVGQTQRPASLIGLISENSIIVYLFDYSIYKRIS